MRTVCVIVFWTLKYVVIMDSSLMMTYIHWVKSDAALP